MTLRGNRLEIVSGADVTVTIGARRVEELPDRIEDPPVFVFNVDFAKPRAIIRALASPDPLFAFSSPLFAFVDEEKRLPLEVALAAGSTPLADSDRILRALILTADAGDLTQGVVTIDESAASPSRDLLFNVAEAKNGVSFTVAVEALVEGQGELVNVAPLRLGAHFLSLEHRDRVEFLSVRGDVFVPDFELVEIALRGEAAGVDAETWTLAVANAVELEDDGYKVEEVVFESPETRIYNIVRQEVSVAGTMTVTAYSVQTFTLEVADGIETEATVTEPVAVEAGELPDGTLAKFEEDAALRTLTVKVGGAAVVYSVEPPADAVTRTLRIRRLRSDAENSRVVLKFAYTPPPGKGDAGEFLRIIELETGVIEVLRVEVRPETLVIPRGGMASVTLVISNLALGDDPSEFISLSHNPDLRIRPQDGKLDGINRRFEQVLQVRALPSGDRPDYEVQVEVRLARAFGRTRFSVDINDPPRYMGEKLLMVLESGETQEYLLMIVDPDGGTEFLKAPELGLEVVFFESGASVENLDHTNDYFDLTAGDVSHEISDENAVVSGNRNSLAVTLTLTGRLATPYGSVVELRLYGVDDGYDELNQRLVVRVVDVPPTFGLETTTIAVLPNREVFSLPVEQFSDGSKGSKDGMNSGPRVVVLEAPDDLVVRFEEGEGGNDFGRITLRRLNASRNGQVGQVKLSCSTLRAGGQRSRSRSSGRRCCRRSSRRIRCSLLPETCRPGN